MNKHLTKPLARRVARALSGPLAALLLGVFASAAGAQTFRMGVPPWPGVAVKSEVASEILHALGYQTEQKQLSAAIIINGLATGSVDIYLGGWEPQETSMIEPLAKQGKVVKLTANISDALTGLAVPAYMADQGVKSMADLNRYADKFDHKIYGIEAGSGINDAIQAAIDKNRYDLGDWSLVQSSTSAMLTQVKRATSRKEPVVFFAWRPHWMNVAYKLHYLTVDKPSDIAQTPSTVYTVVSKELPQQAPNVARFLKQFRVNSDIQSQWIYAYSYKKLDLKDVSHQWIKKHMDVVAQWLQEVKTAQGKPALPAARAAFE